MRSAPSTGVKSSSKVSPYAVFQKSSMSLIEAAASSSISPPSVFSTSRDGSSASGRSPVGPSTAGMPATRNGSLKTETAVPATVVEQDATSSVVQAASTAPVSDRRLIGGAFPHRQVAGIGALKLRCQDSAELAVWSRSRACRTRTWSVVAQNGGSDARR